MNDVRPVSGFYGPLWITFHTSGKLAGLWSVNTSTTSNPFCAAKPTPICQFCYARRLEFFRTGLRRRFDENGTILSMNALGLHQLPYFKPGSVVRFNSFGELINATHAHNLYRIAAENPTSRFTLWTKCPGLVPSTKPPNLTVVYSEGQLDPDLATITSDLHRHSHIDLVFCVDTADRGQINCQRRCADCLACYKPAAGGPRVIHELLRGTPKGVRP